MRCRAVRACCSFARTRLHRPRSSWGGDLKPSTLAAEQKRKPSQLCTTVLQAGQYNATVYQPALMSAKPCKVRCSADVTFSPSVSFTASVITYRHRALYSGLTGPSTSSAITFIVVATAPNPQTMLEHCNLALFNMVQAQLSFSISNGIKCIMHMAKAQIR